MHRRQNVLFSRVCPGFLIVCCVLVSQVETKPHIVFIVADDLGWNDVSWNNREIIMPNLDKLARAGVILNQSYVQSLCTPSRTAFLSGYYPYHVGRQNKLIGPLTPTGLSTNYTLLPEVLRKLGYKTHAVGKWHLGNCNLSYTPTYRGFDTFFGYYLGAEGYYNHSLSVAIPETKIVEWGLDFWNNTNSAKQYSGVYSTEIFKDAAVDIIANHRPQNPLFLYLPFQAVHFPIEVPEKYEKLYRIHNITRRKYCGMVTALDCAVGEIVQKLKARGMWENTILIFTSDNGGRVFDGGNNWPLRGAKATLWEGGTRSPAFVYNRHILKPTVNNNLFHAVDWYPTIISMAEGPTVYDGDGLDQWRSIRDQKPGPRHEFVYNIYDGKEERGAIRFGPYKLIVGDPGQPDGWIPPPALSGLTNVSHESEIKNTPRLYNIRDDPVERYNLAESQPILVQSLLERFRTLRSTMVPADDPPLDPRGRPSLWGNTFAPGWCQAH